MVKYELRKSTDCHWRDGIDLVRCDGEDVRVVAPASYDGRLFELNPEFVVVELNRQAARIEELEGLVASHEGVLRAISPAPRFPD